MDEIDEAAAREGQAMRTINKYAIRRPYQARSVNRRYCVEKDDFMELIKQEQKDVQT